MPELNGKVAVVTGSNRGIGLACLRALLGAGADVVVSGRDAGRSEEAAAGLADAASDAGAGARRARVAAFACDVRDPDACERLVESTVERFGRLDILVNNAGLGVFASVESLTVADFQRQIETNLCGAFYCSKAAVPHLVRHGDGWIVNIGSLAGRNPFAGGAAYNASKFGLLGMTEAMMLDLRHQGVRVSVLMPGSVDTGFSDRASEGTRPWALTADDVARALLGLLDFPARAHVSRVEMRPSRPPR